jgi:hypothetical protein
VQNSRGFVAADTLFSILDNRPVSADPEIKLMFPLVQGLMAFDTPYNGLSRSMFAYGAFSQYQNISSVWNLFSTVSTSLTGGLTSSQVLATGAQQGASWARWQTLASRTGTYGAIVAGGVAAYMHRDQIRQSLSSINRENLSKINMQSIKSINYSENISQGLTYVSRESIGEGFAWMASHLKFVGALMKQAQLTTRLERLSQLKGVGVVNLYTSMGENGYWTGGYFIPKRTFCAVPTDKEALRLFQEQPNTKSKDEIQAHCSMFRPEKNSEYETMLETARDLVLKWSKHDPRKVVDDYQPNPEQRLRSRSESQLVDDDGKVLKPKIEAGKGETEDELQLQAIRSNQDMPEAEDGGVDEEALKRATEVPLPADDEVIKGDSEEVAKALEVPLPADDELDGGGGDTKDQKDYATLFKDLSVKGKSPTTAQETKEVGDKKSESYYASIVKNIPNIPWKKPTVVEGAKEESEAGEDKPEKNVASLFDDLSVKESQPSNAEAPKQEGEGKSQSYYTSLLKGLSRKQPATEEDVKVEGVSNSQEQAGEV